MVDRAVLIEEVASHKPILIGGEEGNFNGAGAVSIGFGLLFCVCGTARIRTSGTRKNELRKHGTNSWIEIAYSPARNPPKIDLVYCVISPASLRYAVRMPNCVYERRPYHLVSRK